MSPKAPTHRTEDLPIAPSDLPMDQALSYDPSRSLLLEHLQDDSLQSTVRVAEPGAAGSPKPPSPPLQDVANHDPESPSSIGLKDPLLSTDSKPQSDDFRFLTKIARGGFGDVWSATQLGLEREVAVKRLRNDRLVSSSALQREQMVEMFRREAITTAHLEHPNVVPVYHLGIDTDGHWLLGMKRVRGRPWDEIIEEDLALEIDDFLARHLPILIDVAQAVAFAHSKGVLHRDLKPQQVMVGEFGEVQLMDWGLAAAFGAPIVEVAFAHDGESSSGSGSFASSAAPGPAGTPSYMAPGQTRGEPEDLGPWTDLYLLGGILYYLLTGSAPHRAPNGVAAL